MKNNYKDFDDALEHYKNPPCFHEGCNNKCVTLSERVMLHCHHHYDKDDTWDYNLIVSGHLQDLVMIDGIYYYIKVDGDIMSFVPWKGINRPKL